MNEPHPDLLGGEPASPPEVYILGLHGGRVRSFHRDRRFRSTSLWRMSVFHWHIERRLRHIDKASIGAQFVKYRYLGWNGRDRAPLRDTLQLVDRLRDRHGADLPIVLLGHSMGARVAAYVAEARPDNIAGVFALAPWWPEREGLKIARSKAPLRVAHGTQDVFTSARSSRRQVALLAEQGLDAEWWAVHGAGHFMFRRYPLWHEIATDWVTTRAVEVARERRGEDPTARGRHAEPDARPAPSETPPLPRSHRPVTRLPGEARTPPSRPSSSTR